MLRRRRHEDPDVSCRTLVEQIRRERDDRLRQLMFQDLLAKSSTVRPEVKSYSVIQALKSFVPEEVASLIPSDKEAIFQKQKIDVAIVTIKERELLAAKLAFDIDLTKPEDRNINGFRYWFGKIDRDGNRRNLSVVVTMVGKERNVSCSIACQRLFNAFEVGGCFLVGVAAGVRDRTEIGDVVCAEMVVDYEHQRLEPDGPKKRPDSYRLQPVMERNLAHFSPRRSGWRNRLSKDLTSVGHEDLPADIREDWSPEYRQGIILSGEKLIADGRLPTMRDEYHERTLAAEQEGSGFCRTCEDFSVPWAVFRGISDHGDPLKTKGWQVVATLSASTAAAIFVAKEYRTREEMETF